MPRIRILQSIAGADFSWSGGEIVDVDGPTASAFADGYRAELVRGPATIETATAAPVETAEDKPRATRKRAPKAE